LSSQEIAENFSPLIYTDLDGTLLDHNTYSFDSALPALAELKKKDIPLIICTSKTRAEIEELRLHLHNVHPFVSENGGAIFIPKSYFDHSFNYDKEDSGYFIIELGTPYSKIRELLSEVQAVFPGNIKGFGDLSLEDIADLCEFSLNEAWLAKKREYDEPLIMEDVVDIKKIKEIAESAHLRIIRGGRFYHFHGENDKGKAVLLLTDLFKKKHANIKTIALGDSQNDLPMLKAVDYPVLVQKHDGSYDPAVKIDNLFLAPGIGPFGWNAAVSELLDNLL